VRSVRVMRCGAPVSQCAGVPVRRCARTAQPLSHDGRRRYPDRAPLLNAALCTIVGGLTCTNAVASLHA